MANQIGPHDDFAQCTQQFTLSVSLRLAGETKRDCCGRQSSSSFASQFEEDAMRDDSAHRSQMSRFSTATLVPVEESHDGGDVSDPGDLPCCMSPCFLPEMVPMQSESTTKGSEKSVLLDINPTPLSDSISHAHKHHQAVLMEAPQMPLLQSYIMKYQRTVPPPACSPPKPTRGIYRRVSDSSDEEDSGPPPSKRIRVEHMLSHVLRLRKKTIAVHEVQAILRLNPQACNKREFLDDCPYLYPLNQAMYYGAPTAVLEILLLACHENTLTAVDGPYPNALHVLLRQAPYAVDTADSLLLAAPVLANSVVHAALRHGAPLRLIRHVVTMSSGQCLEEVQDGCMPAVYATKLLGINGEIRDYLKTETLSLACKRMGCV